MFLQAIQLVEPMKEAMKNFYNSGTLNDIIIPLIPVIIALGGSWSGLKFCLGMLRNS